MDQTDRNSSISVLVAVAEAIEAGTLTVGSPTTAMAALGLRTIAELIVEECECDECMAARGEEAVAREAEVFTETGYMTAVGLLQEIEKASKPGHTIAMSHEAVTTLLDLLTGGDETDGDAES